MHRLYFFPFLICLCIRLSGAVVGNPSEPVFLKDGIFSEKKRAVTLRFGYYYENIYKSKFKDEVINDRAIDSTDDSLSPPSPSVQLRTNASVIFLNIKRFLEVYGIVGQSRLRIEEREAGSDSVFSTQDNLSWGAGVKMTFFQYKGFNLGADGKYFYTRQHADYLTAGKSPVIINTSDFAFVYEESQGCIAVSYDTNLFTPYAGITYLRASIMPSGKAEITIPPDPEPRNLTCNTSKNINHWGLIVGVSVVSKEQFMINLESRMFDQNSLNISAEVGF